MEKSVVLIDGENIIKRWFLHCVENGLDEKIDYSRLVKYLTRDTNLLRAYFYDGVPERIPERKRKFIEALQYQGIQMRTKMLKVRTYRCPSCNGTTQRAIQKGVDVSLATDILRHAFQRTCDICIVVSGDEDYKDAIMVAKDMGIKVWVAAFHRNLSKELRLVADKVIYLEDAFQMVKKEKSLKANPSY